MITLKELIGNNDFDELPPSTQSNLYELLSRINKVRVLWDKPMIVTSGLRSMEHHLEIYRKKGVTHVPMQSNHLYGRAVDISDVKRELQSWCKENVHALESIGIWMEDFRYTPTWLHFQIVAPKSGNRFFVP